MYPETCFAAKFGIHADFKINLYCILRASVGCAVLALNVTIFLSDNRIGIVEGVSWEGVESPQFMSTDAHFWVKIGFKFQSLGKISNILAADPPVVLGQFQNGQIGLRGWNVWCVTIDNVRVVRIASDSCSSVYVCIKRKIQKILTNKVRSLPVLYYSSGR